MTGEEAFRSAQYSFPHPAIDMLVYQWISCEGGECESTFLRTTIPQKLL